MQIKIYEQYLSGVKRELDLTNKETNALLSEKQKDISLKKNDIASKIRDKEYPIDMNSLVLGDTKERNEKLMSEVKTIVSKIIFSNSHVNYIYIITIFIFLLLILSFVKHCML
jgi:hypothetical protein